MRFSFVPVLLAVSLCGLASSAFAWSQGAEFEARVHDHHFDRVNVESEGCTLHYRLYFDAPPAQYVSKTPARNVYRFRVRIDFLSGKSVCVPVFANRAPGRRLYERGFDSTAGGCWAKEPQKLSGVKVEACRGNGCTPDPIP